ncbi:MAG: hypothetical protein IJ668_06910 [Selenomonadaceae bacterium]|nr:hypothetical protein [Selenomonadaceae bacterium]
MSGLDRLLSTVADEYHIRRGSTEALESFKARIIYSALSRQAYAALFDRTDEPTISIQYFKARINELQRIYASLYPEANIKIDLADEIYELYSNAGLIYHAPNRIAPSMPASATLNGITFMRGVTPDRKVHMSGAGFYRPSNDPSTDVGEMFAIPNRTLSDEWAALIRRAHWKVERLPDDAEYLNTTPTFRQRYWKAQPDRDGSISIARVRSTVEYLHYLYRSDGDVFECCQLPTWRSARAMSNACLASRVTLPPNRYKVDGTITWLRLGYLPPPPELNLLKLYSWAQQFIDPFNNFNRVVDTDIFFALKIIFERRGYQFIEE